MITFKSHKSSSPITNYLLEQINSEKTLPKPKIAGDSAPDFNLSLKSGVWTQIPQGLAHTSSVSLDSLLNYRPLVISFYSPEWHRYGHAHIEHLVQAYPKIKALGGELLVLTPESSERIKAIAEYYHLPFTIAQDLHNQIARDFGVYSPYHPVWDRIAGISEEVALPATYVIAPNGQIVFDFIEADFSDLVPVREILSAVYNLKNTHLQKVA